MRKADKSGFSIGCGTGGSGEFEIANSGIIAGHAYTMIDGLMCMTSLPKKARVKNLLNFAIHGVNLNIKELLVIKILKTGQLLLKTK